MSVSFEEYMPVPTDSMSITANGTYDVTNYASASVSVSGGVLPVDGAVIYFKDFSASELSNPTIYTRTVTAKNQNGDISLSNLTTTNFGDSVVWISTSSYNSSTKESIEINLGAVDEYSVIFTLKILGCPSAGWFRAFCGKFYGESKYFYVCNQYNGTDAVTDVGSMSSSAPKVVLARKEDASFSTIGICGDSNGLEFYSNGQKIATFAHGIDSSSVGIGNINCPLYGYIGSFAAFERKLSADEMLKMNAISKPSNATIL